MNTNQLSVNIFLTEKFLGRCWHDTGNYVDYSVNPSYTSLRLTCGKCKHQCNCNEHSFYHQDLFTPNGFFLLWEKAQKEEWWYSFCHTMLGVSDENRNYFTTTNIRSLLCQINPLTFPTLLAEYLGWKE